MIKKESGRSMIEILGVLAIIGVLSVGGIYGYTIAMRRYKANEIAHVASMLYTAAHSANGGDGDCIDLSTTSLTKNPAGVSIEMVADATVDGSKTIIHLQINDSDEDAICKQIHNLLPQNAEYDIECAPISTAPCL